MITARLTSEQPGIVILANSMEQSLSWEANRSLARQESPHILWNLKALFHIDKSPPPASVLRISPSLRPCEMFHNVVSFYGKELLAPYPLLKLEDHPLSVVCDFLFNIFTATLRIWRPFLHPLPEDMLWHCDREPVIMKAVFYIFHNHLLCPEYSHRFNHYGCFWNGSKMLGDACTMLPVLRACLFTLLPPSSK